MFIGNFAHNLDEKGRLVIPSKMRDELGSKAYILKGFDGALSIYKESDFIELTKKLAKLPTVSCKKNRSETLQSGYFSVLNSQISTKP